MTHSLYLLAACLISAGEPAPLPVGPAQPVAQPIYSAPAAYPTATPVYTYQTQESKPSFLNRLKAKFSGLFNKKQHGAPCPCQNQGVPVSAPVIQSEPLVVEQTTLQQTAYPQVPLPQPAKLEGAEEQSAGTGQEINNKFIGKVGHEDDYSWVTGQLYSVRTGDGTFWVVRYATVDTEDKYGGSIVAAPAVNMKNFREGDLVSVKGEIINDGRANKHLAGPLYRVVSIDMIERAD